MIENTTAGLTLLDPDHEVVVTREELHQPALRAYAPRADGRARRVAVELVFAPILAGAHRGQRGIEVRLDGRRVGELTALMAQRYGPLVEDVLRRGGRPGCVGLVVNGRRGIEVELRLPAVGAGAGPLPPGRPAPAPRARRRRAPYLIGAGVAALLIAVGAGIGHGGGETTMTATGDAAAVATTAPATTPARTTRPAPTGAPVVVPPAAITRAAITRAAVPRAPAVRRTTAAPVPERAPTTKPAARKPTVAAAPKPASSCDPNYSGCVPIASDVDCAGGSGNGPAYVSGPVRVTGKDIYGLDADKDGIGCE